MPRGLTLALPGPLRLLVALDRQPCVARSFVISPAALGQVFRARSVFHVRRRLRILTVSVHRRRNRRCGGGAGRNSSGGSGRIRSCAGRVHGDSQNVGATAAASFLPPPPLDWQSMWQRIGLRSRLVVKTAEQSRAPQRRGAVYRGPVGSTGPAVFQDTFGSSLAVWVRQASRQAWADREAGSRGRQTSFGSYRHRPPS